MNREHSLRRSIIEWIVAIALVVGGIILWNVGSAARAMGNNNSGDGSQTIDLCTG